MTFIDPSVEEVYQTLVENDQIINYLKDEKLLLTKSALRENYPEDEVEKMSAYIFSNNVDTLHKVAKALLKYKSKIKSLSIKECLNQNIAWDDLSHALGIKPQELTISIYVNIIYTYKYCYATSFFQNNKDRFLPEVDYYELENNQAAMAYYDAVMKEFDKLDYVLGKCCEYMEYDKIPWDLMSYLTQLLGMEKSTFNLEDKDELKFRELAKNILDIYRIKGTNYSFELFFSFLGYNIKVHEYYFDRRLFYNTSTGNLETDIKNNYDYGFYLTTLNPTDNKLNNVNINETVLSSDISPQYSLKEFNELCEKYGPEVVLGYKKFYNTNKKDENGNDIYEEYTGKIYKYFKTNAIYYDISLPFGNISARQYKTIIKCLNFLTPSYVMKSDVRSKANAGGVDDTIGFDGDGTKEPNNNGGYGSLEILDDEDWSQSFKEKFIDDNGNRYSEDLLPEETIEYHNSLYIENGGENNLKESKKFRLPIRHVAINKSLNRFLTGATKTPYASYKRIKYFIDKKTTENGIIMYPYYTIPPYVDKDIKIEDNTFYTNPSDNPEISLTGKSNNEIPTVKDQIKNLHFTKKVKIVNNVDEYLNSISLNPIKIDNRTMSLMLTKKCNFDVNEYLNSEDEEKIDKLYEYLINNFSGYNFYDVPGGNIINVSKEIIINNMKNLNSIDNITQYYNNPEFYKKLFYGCYVLGLENNTFYLYRFGNYKFPSKIRLLGNKIEYEPYEYDNYVKSFKYKVIKAYNGKINKKENERVILNYKYIENRDNKDIIDQEVQLSRSIKNLSDLDFITKKLYYSVKENEYYKAVRVVDPDFSPFVKFNKLSFENMDKALNYLENHPDLNVKNTEFKIGDDLFCLQYDESMFENIIIYSKESEKLYSFDKNNNPIEYNNFFGNFDLEKECIDLYDESWEGYDEQADEEDFLMYNSYHIINWPYLNINNKLIGRPIKSVTDKEYERNNLVNYLINELCDKTYLFFNNNEKNNRKDLRTKQYFLINNDSFKISPKEYEFLEKNDENYVLSQDNVIDDNKEYYYNIFYGILDLLENNLLKVTNKDKKINYYYFASLNDFLICYYNSVMKNDFSINNFPKLFIEDLKVEKEFSQEQINQIKKYFNISIMQIYILSNYFLDIRNINFYKDDYGDFVEIFSQFKEFISNFVEFINYNNNIVDIFLKQYYYNNLVSLYRENFVDDNETRFEIIDANPMFILYPIFKKYNSSGTYKNHNFLNSSYNLVGNNRNSIKIKFDKLSINSQNSTISFYTNHKNIIDSLGFDIDNYYKRNLLDKIDTSSSDYETIKTELDNQYKNIFKCIKPIFLFKEEANKFYEGKELTNWQKYKKYFSNYYLSGRIFSYDKNNKLVTNSEGFVLDESQNIIKDKEQIFKRLEDGFKNGYVIITLSYKDIPEIPKNISLVDSEELNLIHGYLKFRNLENTYLDNIVSYPKSLKWIQKNKKVPIEFTNLMDDDSFKYYKKGLLNENNVEEYINNIDINKKYSTITINGENNIIPLNYLCSDAFINKDKRIVLQIPEETLKNSSGINDIQIIIS